MYLSLNKYKIINMFKYIRIVCVCIIYISSFYESMRDNIVTAVPFEYINHEQLSSNIDDKQSTTKYDIRLVSQQTNKNEDLSDLSQQKNILNTSFKKEVNEHEEEDLEPHERAASCSYGGIKYTHGQKLKRFDPCEVCLCIDGEIFCWWENCDKHPKIYTTAFNNNYVQNSEKTYKHPKSHDNSEKLNKPRHEQKRINKHLKKTHTYITRLEQKHNQKHRQHQQQLEQHHKYEQNHLATSPTFSKILNFPENLPSVLYHDYKSEEHQHHQYQHHQQHLKHRQDQIQMRHQQQQQQQQQQQHLHEQHIKFEVTTLPSEYPSTENDNVDVETETDSDILPEPPTKRPKMTVTTIPATTTTTTTKPTTKTIATKRIFNVHSTNDGKNADSIVAVKCAEEESGKTCRVAGSAFTPYTIAKVVNGTQSIKTVKNAELNVGNKNENKQYDYLSSENKNNNFINKRNEEDEDDAFHRWLTTNETHSVNNNKYDDSHNDNGVEKTVFDLTELTVLNNTNKVQEAPSTAIIVGTIPTRVEEKTNRDNESNKKVLYTAAESGFLGSAYNDYGSEFNGSVVNIDILLTEPDESRHIQQQHKEQPPQEIQSYEDILKETIIVEADLILRPSVAETTPRVSTAIAAIRATSTSHNNSTSINLMSTTNEAPVIDTTNELIAEEMHVVNKTAKMTTLSPDKQCNVMGIFYQIGDILPQDVGNCLQCICTESSIGDDIPSVTCSPHNCPPLVLPDLFDNIIY